MPSTSYTLKVAIFYMVELIGANLGWIFLHRATICVQKLLTSHFVFQICLFILIFLLIYPLTGVAGQMKFDQGPHLARGPNFEHPCLKKSIWITYPKPQQISFWSSRMASSWQQTWIWNTDQLWAKRSKLTQSNVAMLSQLGRVPGNQ